MYGIVVRVVGDDERAQIVVCHVLREDDLAAERVGNALLEETLPDPLRLRPIFRPP